MNKVLIIDDSDIVRSYVSSMFTKRGFRVHELPSAIGASRLILQNDIRNVIVDVSMPGLSGDRLVNVLRSNKKMKDLFIVIMTERSDNDLIDLSKNTSANRVISKSEIDTLPVTLFNRNH